MAVEKFIALGRNGVVEEVYNINDRPKDYIKVRKEKGAPLIELASDYTDDFVRVTNEIKSDADEQNFLTESAIKIFARWGKFGHYGDVIQFTSNYRGMYKVYTVDYVGRLAFPKGTLAVDLLPFFIDKNGREFFVGITLGKEGPNYGKPALIGGHIDHKEGYFESAAEAIIHEAEEEAGIILLPMEEITEVPIPDAFAVILHLRAEKIGTYVSYLNTFRTAENKKDEDTDEAVDKKNLPKEKRVDWTSAYQMVTEVDFDLSEEVLRGLFKAGSDAKDLLIVPAGADDPIPEFAHDHHREIYLKAREKKDAIVRAWNGIPS